MRQKSKPNSILCRLRLHRWIAWEPSRVYYIDLREAVSAQRRVCLRCGYKQEKVLGDNK